MLKHRRMCKHHLNTVENIYKNIHPLIMDVYTYRIAYVKKEVQCITKLKQVYLSAFVGLAALIVA